MILDSLKKTVQKENWKEHFRYYLSGAFIRREYTEGLFIPRFYLPVWQPNNKDALELWIFPLAPLVWIFYVLKDALFLIWRDMLDLQQNLKSIKNLKTRKEHHGQTN